jgi:hypothetical protein
MWSLMDGDKKGSVGSATFQHRYPLDWGQKASELRGNKALWTHVDTVDSVDSVWSQTRHSTQHTSAQHGSGIRLPPGAPGRRLLMRSAVPLGQQTLGKRQLQSSYMYIYIYIFISQYLLEHYVSDIQTVLSSGFCTIEIGGVHFCASTFAMLMTLITFWYFLQHFLDLSSHYMSFSFGVAWRSTRSCHRRQMGTKPGMWCSSFPRGPEKRMQKGATLHEVLLQCTSKSIDIKLCICRSLAHLARLFFYENQQNNRVQISLLACSRCRVAFQERSKTVKALDQIRHD